ncbi:MAG: hypothetical protein ACT4PO_00080 [Actinomycetota bacterium]
MDVATITMDQEKAAEAFESYREAVKLRHSDEDEAIMRGYRELVHGRAVLKLSESMRLAGVTAVEHALWVKGGQRWFTAQMPRLAIARADAPWVYCDGILRDGSAQFRMDKWVSRHTTRRYIDLPAGTFPAPHTVNDRRIMSAMVPIVPPALRPRGSLVNYHLLFEAEWKAQPPRDPLLLRRLGGDLWAVVATWNLTEIERAVLAGRTGPA